MADEANAPGQGDSAGQAAGAQPGGFRLMRYFTLLTLVAFVVVGAVLYVLQRGEETFFEQVQRDQARFLTQAQAQLAQQHEEAARSSLLAVHEAGHVNLTRLVANLLWQSDFGPFVAATQRIAVEPCRALPAAAAGAAPAAAGTRRACLAQVGAAIRDLPGFKALDAKAYAAMHASTVFKIKVFDLRGITVYSSDHGQIGEDGAGNLGWQSAAAGRPASELTHRDKFSAFEQVVENRDLISTYVPAQAAGRGEVIGVFEIYSDVTPFLGRIKAASQRFTELTAANEASVAKTAQANEEKLYASSDSFLLTVGGLLALLYAASLAIVHFGQRIIDAQGLAQARAAERERLWHREKMAALATMAANVSHEIGNPLAVISGLAQNLAERDAAAQILEQSTRIARMTRQIADFATARSEAADWVDVNAMVKAVCDFFAFDRRFRGTRIEFRPGPQLPACKLVPDHLNEVMMDLLQAAAKAASDTGAALQVGTELRGDRVVIRIGDAAALAAADLASLSRLLPRIGAELRRSGTALEISLPLPRDPPGAA
jgi:signal transduction histidine kinase